MPKQEGKGIETNIGARIFRDTYQYASMNEDSSRGLLQNSLSLFKQVNKVYENKKKIPKKLVEFIISQNFKDVENKIKSLAKKNAK